MLCLVVLLATGCARQPRTPGTLRLAAKADVSTLDPALAYDTGSMPYVRVLYRGLVDYGEGAEIVNVIARERQVSADARTYSFKLRRDVRFHHTEAGERPGRVVVAEDFRYALERVLDPATASDGFAIYQVIDGAKEFGAAAEKLDAEIAKAAGAQREALLQRRKGLHARGIRVRGTDEISITLAKPDPTFINWLAMPFSYAVPRESVEKWGKGFSEHANGSGPFMLENWTHDRHVHLARNPHYFQTGLPRCERIELQIGGDDTLHLMRFELGDIDIQALEDINPPDFLRLLEGSPWQAQIQHEPMGDIRYLCLNTELKPFDNVLVRRAMNYAISRRAITTVMARRATPAKGPLPPGMPGYNPNLFEYPHDPDKAKDLLRQAGYADGFTSTLWYASNVGWHDDAAQLMQQDLKQIGVTVNLKAVTYPELKTAAGKRKNIPMCIIGWVQDFPDPANFLDVLLNGKNITETSSNNRAFYSNPQVNKLLDAAAVDLNQQRRLQIYRQVEEMVVRDAPWVPLFHTERYTVHQPWIRGFRLHPMWSARYEFVEVGSSG